MDEEEKNRMSSTIESITPVSTNERTGVQDNSGTSEKSDEVNKDKINTNNTQTIGQVSQTY